MEEIIAGLCALVLSPIVKKVMAGKFLTNREYFIASILFFPVWLYLVNYCLELFHAARIAEGLAPWPDIDYVLFEPWERALAPFVNALFSYPLLMMVVRFFCCSPEGSELEKADWFVKESFFFTKLTWIPLVLLGFYMFVAKVVFA